MDFWGVCGGRDEGRSSFCLWWLTFVSVLFFLFLEDGEQKSSKAKETPCSHCFVTWRFCTRFQVKKHQNNEIKVQKKKNKRQHISVQRCRILDDVCHLVGANLRKCSGESDNMGI